MQLPKQYNPKESEPKWQKFWEDKDIYSFDENSNKEIYSVDTPPPTVSGKMHIGHAFSFSQQDFIVRFKRMSGFNIFCPFGTDDNGLATERLIEQTKKVNSKKMGREEFISLCLKTLDEIRPDFIQGWKRIGISCDFSIYYSTINEHCRKISQRSFIELYDKGRIYRHFAPVIFCPKCRTAIAQVEMEDKKSKSTLNYIKGKMDDGSCILYATTRPELLYGCVGVSINEKGDYVKIKVDNETWITSKDSLEKLEKHFSFKIISGLKGKKLIGKTVEIPISKNKVEITHDKITDTKYGTGIVYYCTYGGVDCIEWMERHPGVMPIHVMNPDGKYNELSGKYEGMDSTEARKEVLKDLEKEKALIIKDPIEHTVNVHERCGTDIEYIATDQWFIKYLDLKEDFLKYGKKMNWHPKHMRVRYDNWILGLKWDWNISRQRHFGVPIPVWFCKKCNEINIPEINDLPVDPLQDKPKKSCKCGSNEFIGEKDVLDTWATSALSPKLSIELFKDKPVYSRLFPMDLRPQAHDIITFWLFNTVVKSYFHDEDIPWKNIMISGFALDPKGKKMSKSLGNVIEPQEMIEKYSADALRFWAAGSKLGDDLPFQEKDLVTGQKFITKIWNASKFAFMNLNDYKNKNPKNLEIMDKWILTKLSRIIKNSTESFDKYEYVRTKSNVENFFWHTFADNYLEIIKDRVYNEDKRGKEPRSSAQYTLYITLLSIIKMIAPIMPHITEEIYQSYFKKSEKDKSIHVSKWPSLNLVDEKAEKIGDFFISILQDVRKAKSEKNLSMKKPVKKITAKGKITKEEFAQIRDDLVAVTNTEEVVFEKLKPDSKIDYETVIEI